jgi:hypothetical protein
MVTAYTSGGNESSPSPQFAYVTPQDGFGMQGGPKAEGVDSDGDGIADIDESFYGTSPNLFDSDGDGIGDGEELAYWGDLYDADYDKDGVINLLDRDSDNDTFSDGHEKRLSSDAGSLASLPSLSYKLVTGLGPHPENGGWLEVVTFNGGSAPSEQPELDVSWLQIQWPEYTMTNGEARVATGDIDGDNSIETIIGLGPVEGDPALPGGHFQITDDDNRHLLWGQLNWQEYNLVNGETRPACADLDGDGDDEILIGLGPGGEGLVSVFDFVDGELAHLAWVGLNWTEYNHANGETRPAAADVDGDGKDEILVGLGTAEEFPSVPGGYFKVIDDDFSDLAWGQVQWLDYNQKNGETWPSAGDFDADGLDEILIGLGMGSGGSFEVLRYADGELPHLTWKKVDWTDYASSFEVVRPTAGNFDLDGMDEIIVGFGEGGGGWLQAFDDANSQYDFLGSRRLDFDRYNSENGESYPSFSSGGASSCFGDFDEDGDVDTSDLTIFEEQMKSKTCSDPCLGDFDGDGDVDEGDYEAFESNFGRTNCASRPQG